MNKKIIWALSLILVIIVGAGLYFLLNQQRSSQQQTITNFEECAKAGYPVRESYPGQCSTPDGRHFVEDIEQNPFSDSTPITVSGEMTCLTKTGQGPQTMECAIGFKGTDGRQYALKNLFKLDPENKFSLVGLQVEVSGKSSSEETKDPDGSKYDVMGVIDITSIKEL